MKREIIKVDVLVFPEHSFLIAQCLQYDIAAQGRTWSALKRAFILTFMGQMKLQVKFGKKPLGDIPSAPKEFKKMFSSSELMLKKYSLNKQQKEMPEILANFAFQ